jgi:hypothetical protein
MELALRKRQKKLFRQSFSNIENTEEEDVESNEEEDLALKISEASILQQFKKIDISPNDDDPK